MKVAGGLFVVCRKALTAGLALTCFPANISHFSAKLVSLLRFDLGTLFFCLSCLNLIKFFFYFLKSVYVLSCAKLTYHTVEVGLTYFPVYSILLCSEWFLGHSDGFQGVLRESCFSLQPKVKKINKKNALIPFTDFLQIFQTRLFREKQKKERKKKLPFLQNYITLLLVHFPTRSK